MSSPGLGDVKRIRAPRCRWREKESSTRVVNKGFPVLRRFNREKEAGHWNGYPRIVKVRFTGERKRSLLGADRRRWHRAGVVKGRRSGRAKTGQRVRYLYEVGEGR